MDVELSFFHPLLKLKDVLVVVAPVRSSTTSVSGCKPQVSVHSVSVDPRHLS